jgi:hypothetical protein
VIVRLNVFVKLSLVHVPQSALARLNLPPKSSTHLLTRWESIRSVTTSRILFDRVSIQALTYFISTALPSPLMLPGRNLQPLPLTSAVGLRLAMGTTFYVIKHQ